jgi:hypothetical protein
MLDIEKSILFWLGLYALFWIPAVYFAWKEHDEIW